MDPTEDMSYLDMTQGQESPVPTVDLTQATPYTDMAQPNPIAHLQVPPASPAEHGKRKAGWEALAEKFMSDSNLQRAIGMAGAMLMQPKQPGQTNMGNVGNAYVVGTNAYELGQKANLEQAAKLRKEGREERTLQQQEATGAAQREHTGAQTEATREETKLRRATFDDAVITARENRRKLEMAVDEGAKDIALRELVRDNEALKAYVDRPLIGDRARQEIALNEAKLQSLRASAAQATGAAEHTSAQAEKLRLESEGLAAIPPAQRAAAARGSTSGIVQQKEMWDQMYDALPADDPTKAGKSKAQYTQERMVSGRAESITTMMKNYEASGGTDPKVIETFNKLLQSALQQRSGSPAPEPEPGAAKAPAAETKGGKGKTPDIKVGDIYKGHRYKGGPKNLASSWEKVAE